MRRLVNPTRFPGRRSRSVRRKFQRTFIKRAFAICALAMAVHAFRVPAADSAPAVARSASSASQTLTVAEADTTEKPSAPRFELDTVVGRVVWYSDALEQQLGISTVPDAQERVLAIHTDTGQILPLIEDTRARAFRKDQRLRKLHIELLVRRYENTPAVQVIKVFERKDGARYELDYWCDVCSIVMYETGPCACCQDDNRLRKRRVDESDTP